VFAVAGLGVFAYQKHQQSEDTAAREQQALQEKQQADEAAKKAQLEKDQLAKDLAALQEQVKQADEREKKAEEDAANAKTEADKIKAQQEIDQAKKDQQKARDLVQQRGGSVPAQPQPPPKILVCPKGRPMCSDAEKVPAGSQ
jgi:hypothetical protein